MSGVVRGKVEMWKSYGSGGIIVLLYQLPSAASRYCCEDALPACEVVIPNDGGVSIVERNEWIQARSDILGVDQQGFGIS